MIKVLPILFVLAACTAPATNVDTTVAAESATTKF